MKNTSLRIETFALGQWMTNCYVLHMDPARTPPASAPGQTRPCWIVDAGFDPEPMIDFIRANNLIPEKVLLTHGHLDHIAGLIQIRAIWPDLPVLIHADDAECLTDPARNLSVMLEEPLTVAEATGFLEHGQELRLGDLAFQIRHIPGHSPGGVCIYQPTAALVMVGDALFAGSIGRTDFPLANHAQLIRSIQEQLLTLPDPTRILSGHGSPTTIAQERRTNPFLV